MAYGFLRYHQTTPTTQWAYGLDIYLILSLMAADIWYLLFLGVG